MSVDYHIEVRRKADRKLLGAADANCLKTIIDSGLGDVMHLDSRGSDGGEFTYEDVCRCEDAAASKARECCAKVVEKKLMTALASNVEIKRELEDDIQLIEDEAEEMRHVMFACGKLCGIIDCITESLHHESVDGYEPAYQKNGKDLSSEAQAAYVWNDDVICTVKADW